MSNLLQQLQARELEVSPATGGKGAKGLSRSGSETDLASFGASGNPAVWTLPRVQSCPQIWMEESHLDGGPSPTLPT